MKCSNCGHIESRVIDSRPSENNESIRRRLECMKCGQRFTTYERKRGCAEKSEMIDKAEKMVSELMNAIKVLAELCQIDASNHDDQRGHTELFDECKARVSKYLMKYPGASWTEIFKNVPNHYSGAKSMAASFRQYNKHETDRVLKGGRG